MATPIRLPPGGPGPPGVPPTPPPRPGLPGYVPAGGFASPVPVRLPAPSPVPSSGTPPGGPPRGPSSAVPAFDRPTPVVLVGPRPIDVRVVGGMPGGGVPAKVDASADGEVKKWLKELLPFLPGAVVGGAGAAVAGLVRNDSGAAIEQLDRGAKLATAGLMLLGPAGKVAGAALNTFAEGAKATKTVFDAFVARGRELAELDATLAAAAARADVTRLRDDVREGQVLGERIAKLIEMQAKSESTFREIWLPIKTFLLDVLSTTMLAGLQALTGILEGIRWIADFFGGDILKDTIEKLHKLISGILAGDPAGGGDLLTPLLDAVRAMPGLPPTPLTPVPAAPALPPILGGVI